LELFSLEEKAALLPGGLFVRKAIGWVPYRIELHRSKCKKVSDSEKNVDRGARTFE
jgi:hypothetical protein